MKLDCANIFCVFGATARCLDNNRGAAIRLRDATARDARGPSPAQLHGARLLPIDATSIESESRSASIDADHIAGRTFYLEP
jgi:hypothetical protein